MHVYTRAHTHTYYTYTTCVTLEQISSLLTQHNSTMGRGRNTLLSEIRITEFLQVSYSIILRWKKLEVILR